MYHLVWIPKYRKRILKGAIANRIEELFRQCAEVNRWEIHELNIQSDHVHMLIHCWNLDFWDLMIFLIKDRFIFGGDK